MRLFTRFVLLPAIVAGLAFAAAVTTVSPAFAQVPAVSFTGFAPGFASANSTRGYAFDVTGAGFTVTYLSVWDDAGNGLDASHNVGIWDGSGNLLTFATVAAGNVAPLDATNRFRRVDVSPLFLAAGTGYSVGATYLQGDNDVQAFSVTGLSSAANISVVGARFINDTAPGVLVRPTDDLGSGIIGAGSFGGNAGNTTNVSAPEPASLTLLAVGVVGFVVRRRRVTTN